MTDRHDVANRCDATDGQCHLCGDVAVVGRVMEVNEPARTAVVMIDGAPKSVATDLVDARIGDELLVHLGFAIARIDAHPART